MAETFAQFATPVLDTQGNPYTAKACGRERDDGLWEGWIEFENTATGRAVRSARETTQPSASDLAYWASGLTAVYLEGALARALKPAEVRMTATDPPSFDGPAEPAMSPPAGHHEEGHAILNPFSVYEKGPDLLAQELTALRPRHLRQIIKEYHLTREPDEALLSLSKQELGSLILSRVRDLHA